MISDKEDLSGVSKKRKPSKLQAAIEEREQELKGLNGEGPEIKHYKDAEPVQEIERYDGPDIDVQPPAQGAAQAARMLEKHRPGAGQQAPLQNGPVFAQPIPDTHWALKVALKAYTENSPGAFQSGDIVDWKPGLMNRSTPGPFIVVKHHGNPRFDEKVSFDSYYYREPLDLQLGLLMTPPGGDPSGRALYMMWVDARRFQKV